MDPAQLKEFGTRYTAAWCSQNPASVATFFSENGSLQINKGAPSAGRAAITTAAQGFMRAFPDMVVAMDSVGVEGRGPVYRWTLTGTNTGPGGSGNSVRISGYEEWTFGADGLIAESKGHFDEADYKRQLSGPGGMLPATADTRHTSATDDAEAVRQAVRDVYSTFSETRDKQKYRSLLTEDYLLLENGELLDIDGDLALMPAPDSGYRRTDAFDFRLVKVHDDTAYAVYFLRSEMTDTKEGTRRREWLESAVLRRSGTGWKMALLHSTRLAKPGA